MSRLSERSQALVRELLESAQLQVDDIPRGDTPTADFLAHDDRHRYLVEVTDRPRWTGEKRPVGDGAKPASRFASETI